MPSKRKIRETIILIMPAFNEAKRIKKTLIPWLRIINAFPGSEILIIDGNSSDRTRDIVKKLIKTNNYIKLIHKKREGYGKDLIYGYKKAIETKHDWIFQTDSDEHFNPNDFFKLWEKRESSPLIIGERFRRKDSAFRLILSSINKFLISILFRRKIKDPNIPFRLIKRTYLKKIIGKIPKSTIAPNIFMSVIASSDGHNIQNIPVKHKFQKGSTSKLRLIKGAFKGLFELIIFKLKQIDSIKNESNVLKNNKKIKISPYHKSLQKFIFDKICAFIILITFSLPLIIISLILKFLNGGPIFFIQKRVGKNGKVFRMFKFRTMKVGSEKLQGKYKKLNEADGPVFKIKNDPRYTKFGKKLAQTGLDELPQLFNVLKSEMSMVGPRPLPVYEAKKLTKSQKIRELIKPGITSTWVTRGSHNLSFKKWMEFDKEYVKRGTLTGDLQVLLSTIKIIKLG